jgi:opacity protein-like surface antigen
MKLTKSIIAIIALSSMSFAGGDIIEPVFEQETVVVPVEPVVVPTPAPAPAPAPVVKAAPVVVAPVVAEALGLYIAGGITDVATRSDDRSNLFSDELNQDRQVGLTARLGYDFMDNLGAELRGTVGVSEENEGMDSFQQIGAYLKPNYDITEELNLYGLVGASSANLADPKDMGSNETGLSYGLGLDYSVTDTVSVFTDVLNYMKKSDTNSLWGLTVGAGYQF